MKSIRLQLTALALLAAFVFGPPGATPASAQASINCAPSTPCNPSTGPAGTGTGDQAWQSFGKINANFALLPPQLFAGAALPVNKGGTGALTLTGLLKGNGTGAFTIAASSDVIPLWSGTCSASTFLRGDGSCQTPAGSGNVSNVATPTNGQIAQWTSATTIQGLAVTGTGSAVLATSPTLVTPTIGVATATSVNGTTIPASATLLTSGGALGTPASGTATNLTGLPLTTGVTGILPLANGGTASATLAGANIPVQSGAITSGHCVQWATSTSITDSGSTCGAGGSSAFSALTSSTNTSAAMLVGTGASLGTTGTGSITASALISGIALGTPASGVLTNATGLPNASVVGLGTFATANAATPPAIGGTTPAAGTFSSLKDTGVTGSTQCLHVDTTGAVSGTGSDCGSGGSTAFSALTGGTNTVMAGVVGTGASLATSGTGTIAATSAPVTGVTGLGTGVATFLATPSSANLAAAITDETGTGAAVFAASPTLVTPTLGAATATTINSVTIPSGADTVDLLGTAQTITGVKTVSSSGILVKGSSTGTTAIASANASATNFTATLPAATDTIAELAATQTLTNKSIAASEVNSGTLAAAQMPALTGDVTSSAGAVATTVVKINGTTLSGLATGILKNTTATGVPSIATSADVIADWSGTCSASTFLRGDGSCQTPAGGGNVSNSGTPTIHQTGVWQSATTISGVGPGTTGQAFASTGASTDPAYTATLSGVTSVNGTSIPSSATLLTSGGALGTPSSGTLTNATGLPLAGLATQVTATVVANTSGSTASPTAVSLTSFQAALVAANANLVADATPGSGPINDYSPSGYGTTTSVLYVTPAGGGTTIDGIVAGTNMQQVFIINAEAAGGADLIKLVNQSASDTTAANRFLTSATVSLAIPPGGRVGCIYLAGSINRWSCQ